MQILSIGGENIASLAKPFDICFDQGPLAGVGLFAITGETGAGKSSLLDAMCLALYGDCPRLGSGGVNDTVPDVSGEMLQSTDARTLLRRGAISGYAEVRFLGRDDEVYQAKWSVRRARNKASNKLQAVDRSVTRLSDGVVLESQTRAVNDKIVALTGLTYDEFRRSVLLAQGDFDSFLSAKTTERAAILEKVTGTALYRDISRRVFAATTQAQRGVQDLELQLGEHQLLGEDTRAALMVESETLSEARATGGAQIKVQREQIAHHTALAAAHMRITQALAEQEAALAQRQSLAPDALQLATLRRVAPLRSHYSAREAALIAEQAAEAEMVGQEASLANATLTEQQARVRLQEVTAQLAEIELGFAALGPIWSQAEQLDTRITTAQHEEQEAAALYHQAKTAAQVADTATAKTSQQLATIAAQIATLQQALDQDPQGDLLLSGWPILADRIERRIAASAAMLQAEAQGQALSLALQEGEAQLSQILAQITAAQAQSATFEAQLVALGPSRQKLQAASPAEHLLRVSLGFAALGGLVDVAGQHQDLTQSLAETGLAIAATTATLERAQAQGLEAQTHLTTAEIEIRTLEAPVARAEAAISPQAERLRLHLVDGAPCPVCLSTSHPVHASGPAATLAQELRAQLDRSQAARQEAISAIARHKADSLQAVQGLAQLEQQRVTLQQRLQEVALEYHRMVQAQHGGALSAHLPVAPDGALPDLAREKERLIAIQQNLQADLTTLEALDHTAQSAEAQLARLAAEQRRLHSAQDQIRAQAADQIRARDTATTTALSQGQLITGLEQSLSRDFAPLKLAWAQFDAKTGAAVFLQLTMRKEAFAALRGQMVPQLERQAEAGRLLDHAQLAAQGQHAAVELARARWGERQAQVSACLLERAGLLEGQETKSHRSAFNLRRKMAAGEKDEAAQGYTRAASTLAAAQAQRQAAAQSVAQAVANVQSSALAFVAVLARVEMSEPEALVLLGWQEPEIEALAQKLQAAETRCLLAQDGLKTRQQDLADHEAQGLGQGVSQTDLPALEAALFALEEADEAQAHRLADIRGRLQADQETQSRLASLVAEIQKAKAQADTLAAVNDTIGSANGDRFSTIAQEVTLALLVEQANHHLKDVKPRYRLAIGQGKLSLHVVDEHMAGEIRSTRSLSGGERFLVSLALALALSTVGGTGTISGTLFIDEGFGTLDGDSLEMAIDALEALQAQGRTIGVISHVQAMQERIPLQIRVTSQGAGASEVRLPVA